MSTDDAADYEKARKWLEVLTNQVIRLREHQRIWAELQEMISKNPNLHKPSVFYEWLNDMYVSGIAMAVRRQTDDDTRSVSFFRFLKLIKGNPSLVSRQRYRALFAADDELVKQLDRFGMKKQYMDSGYDELVGEKKAQPSADDIETEIGKLLRLTDKIVTLADKIVAHDDEDKPSDLPTFAEVDEAISYLEELAQRYNGLFRATHVSMDIGYQYDWKAIFRVPWIP